MRESHSFAKRSNNDELKEPMHKYFLLFEGSSTEHIYFEAINESRESIGMNISVQLVPVLRNYSENNWSNPQKIIKRLRDNLDESRTRTISYNSLLDVIIECIDEAEIKHSKRSLGRFDKELILSKMREICRDKLEVMLEFDVNDIMADSRNILNELHGHWDVLDRIPDMIENFYISYDAEWDKICCIIDRDKKSFIVDDIQDQYGHVVALCRKYNFKLFISNPCFELWLLLHFDKINQIDLQCLQENKVSRNGCSFAEKKLREWMKAEGYGFHKAKYDAMFFIDRLSVALNNEKKYAHDIDELRSQVGSNVGLLMEELIDDNMMKKH
jgi:hypothetical protein